ncbi:hypothetical protein LTR64_000950 [Lithohypha guttulata]|uniref:uncharacterized protein n=1 Tax=Lithohypha guttulata TaxID=1690604 RepID=UPI002DE01FB8|nr:hypothetical protein LTR51_003144 [Lithohypha guttulata]
MPRAKEKSSGGLSIELDDNRKFYTPGSKVSGIVTLSTAQDFAIGSVNIEFYGRVKVFMVYSHGNGETYYRGRAPLFTQSQMMYQGYHKKGAGTFTWDFSFDLPVNPDVATIKQAKHQWKDKEHFLSTDDYIPGHQMPPTFKMWKWGFGYRWHAFVEYVLMVEVKEAQGASMVLPAASKKAVKPLVVKHVATSHADTLSLPMGVQFALPDQLIEKSHLGRSSLKQQHLQSSSSRHTIRTSRLHGWNRDQGTSLSFSNTIRDRTKSLFNSSSLPCFTFDLRVDIPEELRLLQPGSIPILVNVVPVQDESLTTIQPDNYPNLRVSSVTLEISASTYIRFKSILPAKIKAKYDVKLLDRQPVNHTINIRQRQHRCLTNDHNQEEDEGPNTALEHGIDLSTLPGLAPALVCAKMGLSGLEKPLVPTFNTYIIAREYTLSWKLELEVAGEKLIASNDDKIRVRVLPPEAEALEAIMRESDATKAEACDEAADEELDHDSEEMKAGSTCRKAKSHRKTCSKKSKSQEASEEAAAIESFTATASNSRCDQHHAEDVLPTYQYQREFVYRNEIDEPPRYEAQ